MSASDPRRREPGRHPAAWRGATATLLCLSAACGPAEPLQARDPADSTPRLAVTGAAPATVTCGQTGYRLAMRTRLAPAQAPTPMDVDLGPDGTLYVLDQRQVRRFRLDGTMLPTLDPSRDGFYLSRGPLGMAIGGRGEMYVWDPNNQMMLVYPAGGAAPYTFTVLGQSYGLPARVEAGEPGRVVTFVVQPSGDRMHESARVFNDRGEPLASLGPFPVTTSIAVERGGIRSSVTLPLDLSARTVLSLTPRGGFLMADSRAYRLAQVQGRDTVWRASRAVPDVRPTRADIRNALALAPSGIGRRALRRLLPETKSAVVELLSSRDWLLVRRPIPSAYTSPALYDLYRAGSTAPCATVELPPRVLAMRGDLLAGINYEDPQRPVVEVYALTRESER